MQVILFISILGTIASFITHYHVNSIVNFNSHASDINSISISGKGEYIVSGSDDDTISLYSSSTFPPLWGYTSSYNWDSVSISDDGNYIVGATSNRIYLFNRTNPNPLWSYLTLDDINSVVISANGETIVAVSDDNYIYVLNRSSQSQLWNYTSTYDFQCASISSTGEYIVAGSLDNRVYFFYRNTSTPQWNYQTLGNIYTIAISADGQYIVAGSDDSNIYFFHQSNSNPTWSFVTGATVRATAISGDGQYIAVGNNDGTIYLFNRTSSTPEWSYAASDDVRTISISADGRSIVAGSYSDMIYMFNQNSSIPLWTYSTEGNIYSVAISADGECIAAGGADDTIYILNKYGAPLARSYQNSASFYISFLVFLVLTIIFLILPFAFFTIDTISRKRAERKKTAEQKRKEKEAEEKIREIQELQEIERKRLKEEMKLQEYEKKINEAALMVLKYMHETGSEPTRTKLYTEYGIDVSDANFLNDVQDLINSPVDLDLDKLSIDEIQNLDGQVTSVLSSIKPKEPLNILNIVVKGKMSIIDAKTLVEYLDKITKWRDSRPLTQNELEELDELASKLLAQGRKHNSLDLIALARKFNTGIYSLSRSLQLIEQMDDIKIELESLTPEEKQKIMEMSRPIAKKIEENPNISFDEFAEEFGPYKTKKALLFLKEYLPEVFRGSISSERKLSLQVSEVSKTTIQLAYPEGVQTNGKMSEPIQIAQEIKVKRGGEFQKGKYIYKVKIENPTPLIITDVLVQMISFPDGLKLTGDTARKISKINASGSISPTFEFVPKKDCVDGKIHSTVTYLDALDKTHSIVVDPYEIRHVCGLLQPLSISISEFRKITEQLLDFEKIGEELQYDYEAEMLYEKVKAFLPDNNFEMIWSQPQRIKDVFVGTIQGFAQGKFSKKKVALDLRIYGKVNEEQCSISVTICAQDKDMVPALISEMMEGFQWKGNAKDRSEVAVIVQLANNKNGIITKDQIIAELGWDLKKVNKTLEIIEKNSLARKITSASEGDKWIFIGLCNE
ncbi:MAG: hypothetical protein EAX96_19585 [Candidatus Lokiarchaeota archaeon]|nr:hypothetical protein [Candidatus Lokiarchaeota archaeon]